MPRKLADDLMKKNEEYTKLRSDEPAGKAPRENPDHQIPGNRGFTRPELDKWTTEEIRDLAISLDMQEARKLDREALIERLLESSRPRR